MKRSNEWGSGGGGEEEGASNRQVRGGEGFMPAGGIPLTFNPIRKGLGMARILMEESGICTWGAHPTPLLHNQKNVSFTQIQIM